jgi:hypothetical protein
MTPYLGFLVAMQAAGMIVDLSSYHSNQKIINMGRQLENAAFETNMQALKLESTEASIAEMKQLRENLGNQIATNAARGTSSSQGSALSLQQKSIGTFNADERTRRINLMAKESQLRANKVLSGLHTLRSETELGRAMVGRQIDKIPTSATVEAFGKTDLGKKWGFGIKETA